MPYCTAADVRTIVDTPLADGEISDLIETSDAEIDRWIGVQSGFDKLVKKLSMLLTAHAIRSSQSQTQAVGEYREDAGDILEVWEREIERIYRLYRVSRVKASEYEEISESERR